MCVFAQSAHETQVFVRACVRVLGRKSHERVQLPVKYCSRFRPATPFVSLS